MKSWHKQIALATLALARHSEDDDAIKCMVPACVNGKLELTGKFMGCLVETNLAWPSATKESAYDETLEYIKYFLAMSESQSKEKCELIAEMKAMRDSGKQVYL